VPGFGRLIDTGALDVVMIDPGRAEGVTGSRRSSTRAAARQSWNAHSWSSAINTAASLHLAAASPMCSSSNSSERRRWERHRSDPIVMEDGFIAVRDAGPGINVDEAAVRRYLFD
jgi:L-alanine-DL-glutamate epimerase-like enolase superfamily enzyme